MRSSGVPLVVFSPKAVGEDVDGTANGKRSGSRPTRFPSALECGDIPHFSDARGHNAARARAREASHRCMLAK